MTFNRFAGLGTLHALRTLVFRSRTAWLGRFRGREGDAGDESASVCPGGAGRQRVWMFRRRPGAPCSDTANTSVPWKESLQDTTRAPALFRKIIVRDAHSPLNLQHRQHPSSVGLVGAPARSEEHTSELQSRLHLVCRLLLEKKKNEHNTPTGDDLRCQDDPSHTRDAPARLRQRFLVITVPSRRHYP